MYDVKLIDSVNGRLSAQTWPHPDYVSSTYSLVQQIFKCLVTNPGEDSFDPSFGSGLRSQIIKLTGQEYDRAKQVVGAALKKVVADLTSGTLSLDPAERLIELQLVDLKFSPEQTAWSVSVNVVTEAGTQPIVYSV